MKKEYKKKLVEDAKIFLKKKKENKQLYGHECYKNLSKDKNKSLLIIRKIIECEKMPHYNYEKLSFQKVMTEKNFLFGCLKL